MNVGLGNGKLHTLVLTDGTTKDVALPSPLGGPLHKPAPIANTFRSDKNALGVHAIQDIAESLPLFTDETPGWQFHLVEVQLVGLVVHHDPDRLHDESMPDRGP